MQVANETRTRPDSERGLSTYSVAFAKALAVFLRELGLFRNQKTAGADVAGDPLPQSWDELPAALQQEIEAEIEGNNEQLAAGQLEALELTDDTPVVGVANRLRTVAQEKGMAQKDIAEKLDISPSVVSKIFKDPDRSKVATLRKIADALDVDLRSII